jgi:YbbR domain-containing protein
MDELRRFAGVIWFFARGAVASVWTNFSLFLLSLALAISLWFFVTDRENPTEVEAFGTAIPVSFVNVPDNLAIASVSQTTVQIRVEAPRAQFDDLTAEDFEATVDLSGRDVGEVTVNVSVQSGNNRTSVASVSPRSISVILEPERSKEVPVRVSTVGAPQQGFAAVSQSVEPDTVTVTGAQSLVDLVDSAVAEVELTGLRFGIQDERVTLEPRDARDGGISRVTVSPPTAVVSVEIEQLEFSEEFVVNPTIVGAPAPGYNVTAITVEPSTVTVTGSLAALQSIDAVRGIGTEEILIADSRTDEVRQVQPSLPPNVRLQGSPTVLVTITIAPAQGERSFLVVPQVQNVADGLALSPVESVSVTLAGDVPVLNTITPESISVIANAQDLGPGLHALPLQISPPPGTRVARSQPGELGIALSPRQ